MSCDINSSAGLISLLGGITTLQLNSITPGPTFLPLELLTFPKRHGREHSLRKSNQTRTYARSLETRENSLEFRSAKKRTRDTNYLGTRYSLLQNSSYPFMLGHDLQEVLSIMEFFCVYRFMRQSPLNSIIMNT